MKSDEWRGEKSFLLQWLREVEPDPAKRDAALISCIDSLRALQIVHSSLVLELAWIILKEG